MLASLIIVAVIVITLTGSWKDIQHVLILVPVAVILLLVAWQLLRGVLG